MGISLLFSFLKRILVLGLIYSISRLAFLLYNLPLKDLPLTALAFLEGLRFDLSALLYINSPVLILLCVLFFVRQAKAYKRFVNIVFYTLNIPFILLNNIDTVFYSFNLKRSTVDFFSFITYTDFTQVYLNYVLHYWPITALSVLQLALLFRLKHLPSVKHRNWWALPILVLSAGLLVLGLRGGTQLKPIKTINAGVLSNYPKPELILNTPFTMLHSYNQQSLSPYNYFSGEQLPYYNTMHRFQSDAFQKDNVVIIILESFSKEFVGYYNGGQTYTPFLDSLLQTGLAVQNAYANGIRSIEALPAITAAIPSLMNEAFITSSYANNHYQSLATLLKNEGYQTSFFHGGQQGTMGFYEFSKKAGFSHYYGREEYNNDADYDNNWGIYDEPFFQYFAQQLDKEKTPFLSVFFSLTSHPPYQIPPQYKGLFPLGDLDIHESIGYSDNALRQFFKTAQQMDWFDNTLFVVTADHTSPLSSNKAYKNKVGRYAVPMLFWRNNNGLEGQIQHSSQHIDILPTVLDLLGYEKEFFSFGKSILNDEDWAITFLKNEYLMLTKDAYLLNKEEVYKMYKDPLLKEETELQIELVNQMKAIKQGFNNSMITNQMKGNDY